MIGGLLIAAAVTAVAVAAEPGLAQQPPAAPGGGAAVPAERAPDAATFVTHATSLATLQIGAAERAADQASREEVKDLARDVARSQSDVMQRLEALAGQLDVGVPSAMLLEHRAVFEGLAPLTGEEFNRRYAEM
ncbi:MAG TPA: DUF4142 domain-containing protein [Geminicoccaceae bacterium]|nr:DUF4142 domain-containing protein [Geminicoccaceae bacterium]